MRFPLLLATVAVCLVSAEKADAQILYYAGYAPAPTAVVAPAPVVAYRPVVVTSFSPVVAPAPVAAVVARPVVAAPVVAAPVVRTRWRPILGGTVSRVRYRGVPAVVAF